MTGSSQRSPFNLPPTEKKREAMMKILYFLACLQILAGFSLPVSGFSSLLVFGDSYVDTGNAFHLFGIPPNPYGITYPGNTTGRNSDGLLFTDTFSEYLGIRPGPTPSLQLKGPAPPSGVNFAIAGAGVFAFSNQTNLAAQVDAFERLVNQQGISSAQVASSLVLLSIGGNDYLDAFTAGSFDIATLTPKLINGTYDQLIRIFNLGARYFAILNLPPAQCAPRVVLALSIGDSCLPSTLLDFTAHNQGLKQLQQRLSSAGASVTVLDLYNAALYVINHSSCFNLAPSIFPCCFGTVMNARNQSGCGAVNLATNAPLFTVCATPSTALFWDGVHPTQATWKAISSLFFFSTGYTMPGPSLCKAINVTCTVGYSEPTSPGSVGTAGYCRTPFETAASPAPAPAPDPAPAPRSEGNVRSSPALLLLCLISLGHLFFSLHT